MRAPRRQQKLQWTFLTGRILNGWRTFLTRTTRTGRWTPTTDEWDHCAMWSCKLWLVCSQNSFYAWTVNAILEIDQRFQIFKSQVFQQPKRFHPPPRLIPTKDLRTEQQHSGACFFSPLSQPISWSSFLSPSYEPFSIRFLSVCLRALSKVTSRWFLTWNWIELSSSCSG